MSVLPPHWHSSKQPGESIQLVASPLGNICIEYIPHIPAYLGVARRIGFCLAHLRAQTGNWHILNAWGCWEQKMYLGGFLQPSPDTLIVRARDAKHVGERKKKKRNYWQISLIGKYKQAQKRYIWTKCLRSYQNLKMRWLVKFFLYMKTACKAWERYHFFKCTNHHKYNKAQKKTRNHSPCKTTICKN